MNTTSTHDDTMLMNPKTGGVAPESEWRTDFENIASVVWGGPKFEDAGLIEVERDVKGRWVAVKKKFSITPFRIE